MCRMCSYYNTISLQELPTSNPFTSGEDHECSSEPALPTNIIVESPWSQQYVAWRDPHRFPSLHEPARLGHNRQTHTTSAISIHGPSGLPKRSRKFSLTSPKRKLPSSRIEVVVQPVPAATSSHNLQHSDRSSVSSVTNTNGSESDSCMSPSSPKSLSSISDEEEFSYLARSRTPSPSPSSSESASNKSPHLLNTQSLASFNSEPPDSRQACSKPTEWIAQICGNL